MTQLSHEDLIRAFKAVYTARRLDDREVLLKRQNKIFFQISGAGHEAIQVATALAMKPVHDWVFPYYRDRALCLMLGVTPEQMLYHAVGAAADRASGGRQMPSHFGDPALRIVSASSPTGTQFLQACGCAEASRRLDPEAREVVLVTSGDGATSEGEFWEALNIACILALPVVFLIEDNGYAISVPIEHQTAGGNIARLVSGYPRVLRLEVDGCDVEASHAVMVQAFDYARAGYGPALVRAAVIRPYSHSLSDDEKFYRPDSERDAEARRDPFQRFPEWLVGEGVLTRHELQRLIHELEMQVQAATDAALRAPAPAASSALRHLYSETVDPCSDQFDTPRNSAGEPRTMVDAINRTLEEEMERDPRIVVFGEDVADCSREQNLALVKGKGGVFKATQGLQRRFGADRCFNTPLAEAAIAGRAVGMAVRGLKPVPEIQFFDYIWPAMMQIRGEMATMRWRSNGGFSCPLVLRVPIGGYLSGGAIYHSQSGEVLFTHLPGLRVVMPSNALDACGLLRTALRCDDPVLFLEHKKLYREAYNRAPHPGPGFCIPFGRASLVKPGQSLTIVTYGATVQKSLQAAALLERKNPAWSVEVIDLRSLAPYDWGAIRASVLKTSRALVVHEDVLSFGYGAEIAARISAELFGDLDAPVERVAALDTWVGYNPELEDAILPQTGDITDRAEKILRY
ncbi:MAG: dehydrogenase [Acidobacteria bacterium]|nr:dehydrogenase [Acidobacteriota bacterium]